MKTKISHLMGGAAALAISFAAVAANAGDLTLYTSQPEADAAKTVERFQAAYPDVTVQVYRSGTSDILSKMAAEFAAGAPQADVLLIADAVSMELLKGQDRLLPYPEADVTGFAADIYDADHTYFGSKLITTGIAYHSDAPFQPKTWADLTNPEIKGQIVMPSPLYSGAAAFLLSTFVANPTKGWDYFDKLKANDLIAVRGNGAVLKSVAAGEKPYGILVDFMALNAKAQGSPIEFVFPEEGVIAVTEPVAIMKTSDNPEDAKKFIDFILSEDGQKLALEQGYLPANTSVGTPAWLPEGTKVTLMPSDIPAVVKATEGDKAKFAEMFGG